MLNRSRRLQLMILICQTVGICSINSLPSIASTQGTIGCIGSFFAVYILLGIPLMYMELIIGQFTGRDCVDVWKIRPFLSHTGYVLVLWQVIILMYNHTFVSFVVHYFFISFENPIPYYVCGPWSTTDCDILIRNYTVTEDCVKRRREAHYCNYVHATFPEYQYWRYHVLQVNINFYIAWRVSLASGLVCIFLYLSCFKRKTSLKWVVSCLPIYPILVYVILMMGSMLQKGLVTKFEDALDLDFSDFAQNFRLSNAIQHVVYNLGIGSGVTINFASTTSFRSNCFSNSVIIVIISAIFCVLIMSTTAMMACPYSYHYGMSAGSIMKSPMSLVFEKIPRLLSHYESRFYWLILVYSCYVVVGLCTNVLLFYNLLETMATRNEKIAKYPGLTCFVGVLIIFLGTIPLLSSFGMLFALAFRRYVTLASTIFATIECCVFILSYGIHKFSEDVHFMLGIQPSFFMKSAWFLASVFLLYAVCNEMIYCHKPNRTISVIGERLGTYTLLALFGIMVIVYIVRMLVAVCRKRFKQIVSLESSWGPKSDILQRSRAMFSAQAMTKEYMYRQYHLQAGIISRQKNSNKRNVCQFEEQRYSL